MSADTSVTGPNRPEPESGEAADVVYVSWGGTGRAATLRRALNQAYDNDQGLIYLAILDDSTFGDIDESMLELAKDELAWLLDAQLELAMSQTGLTGVAVSVLVREGDVAEAIVAAAGVNKAAAVLVGAPIPEGGAEAVAELMSLLNSRLDVPVTLIEP